MRRFFLTLTCLFITAISFVFSQTVTATIPAETTPYAIGVNPVTNKLYIANESSPSGDGYPMTVVDGFTNTTVVNIVDSGQGRAAAVNAEITVLQIRRKSATSQRISLRCYRGHRSCREAVMWGQNHLHPANHGFGPYGGKYPAPETGI
jgi:hypothetical protein